MIGILRYNYLEENNSQLQVAALLGVSDSLVSDYRRLIESNLRQLSFDGASEARHFKDQLKRTIFS